MFPRLLILAVLALGLSGCGSSDDDAATVEATTEADSTPATTETAPGVGGCAAVSTPQPKPDGGQKPPTKALDSSKTYRLVFKTNCGDFTVTLDQKKAPKTTASLVSLARKGFFDGTTFHRVVPGFVIQGGDPTGTGSGGPGYTTVDPPPRNAAYTLGVVAMAKTDTDPAGAAGSQFFVVTGPDAGLPPDYAIVGDISGGMGVVTAIGALGVGDGPPSQPVVIEKVTVQES